MLLYASQFVSVAGGEYAVVTYSDKMSWQYMKRQQVEESIDVHGHDGMPAPFPVILVVIRDSSASDFKYPGVGDGHAIGIAPDVFEHLVHPLCRWLGMYDPVRVETLPAGGLWDGKPLLLQPACQQAHETAAELTAHGSDREEEGRTPAAMNLMPYAVRVNASTWYDAMNVRVVKKIRAPRVKDGCHACLKPLPGSEGVNSAPCSLEHTVVELALMRHGKRMQTGGQRENDMEVSGRDDFFSAEVNPLLPLLVLALGTVAVTAAVVTDSDIPAFGTGLYMSAQGTGTAQRHVPERSFYRRNDLMLAEELSAVAPDNLTDVEARPHRLGGNMVSIRRTCLIGSMSAT